MCQSTKRTFMCTVNIQNLLSCQTYFFSTEWSIPLPPTLAEHQLQLQLEQQQQQQQQRPHLTHVSSNPAGLSGSGVPKPPLKKHHSFPYEMFQNDTTSYSSEGEDDFQDIEAIR